ncbi:MAG: hypothetical protein HKO84_02380 [Pseudomonadales bacterium]|nr:hypothetical protein [Pseudomonadales bacterium]
MSRFMISLCPHCNIEQMVTAIALQERRGVVTCVGCASDFKPRAHRVTPARERAFKQREREQSIKAEVQATPVQTSAETLAAKNLAPADSAVVAGADADAQSQASADLSATAQPTEQVTPVENPVAKAGIADAASVAEVFLQRLAASIDALGERFGERLAVSLRDGMLPTPGSEAPSATSQTLSKEALAQELSKQEQAIAAELAQQHLNHPRSESEEGEQNMKNETGADNQKAPAAEQLSKARQTIARQKMLLDYQKLRHESEKLEVEKKKLELERVKLEILRKHNLLENKKLQPAEAQSAQPIRESRPVVEYDVKADILPRTPTAIEPDPRIQKPATSPARAEARPAKKAMHLELMPSEPKSMFRRNIGTKANKLK